MSDQASEEKKDPEKKIIVDDDWKSQVQAEKEEAQRRKQESAATEPGKARVDEAPADAATADAAADQIPLPPANFQTLISMLATQVMLSLGALPHPITGKLQVNLPQAKHSIDLLGVLQEKTKGNCTPDESRTLETMQHEFRMAFIAVQSAPPSKVPPEERNDGSTEERNDGMME